MPTHRDWTRHGVGRALLWWPFLAFVAAAAFPTAAVPGVATVGALLIVIGLVGGAVGRRVRERRLREARRAATAFAPRRVREAVAAGREPVPAAQLRGRAGGEHDDPPDGIDADRATGAAGDRRSELGWSAA